MSFQNSVNSSPCFFLIDDNLGDLYLMESALKELFPSAKVLAFESGEDLEKYSKEQYRSLENSTAIFVDYHMPGCVSSKEVVQFVRARISDSVPIYIFSGALLPSFKSEMINLGVRDFLEKPLTYLQLLEMLQVLLKKNLSVA